MFEIINNFIENILISFFVAKYINLETNKEKFIISTVIINTLVSTLLSYYNIIGISQTLIIQFIICFFLYKYNDNFSFQNVAISLYCNILLFIAIYCSILLLSFTYNIKPFQVYNINDIYIYQVLLSKAIFLIMTVLSLLKRPLLFTKIKIKEINYLLSFELLIIMIMAYYFLSIILNENYNRSASTMFFCFVLLFFSFCCIFNRIIYMNQQIYENTLKNEQEHYRKENLKNLNSIKMHIDNTEHRINYILQSIGFDLKEKNYKNTSDKIKICKELVHKITPVLHTNNELFDFMLNLEIKYFLQNGKQIKICSFISQNHVYDRLEIINNITDLLKLLYKYVDKLEFFITENEDHDLLKVTFIIPNSNLLSKDNIQKYIIRSNKNIQTQENKGLLILSYVENLNEYM